MRWGLLRLRLLGQLLLGPLARPRRPRRPSPVPVPGLDAAVTILRDRHGIPRISAARRGDLFAGLGYAMGTDRLWQMDLLRRVARGEMSAAFGERPLGAHVAHPLRGLNLVDLDLFYRALSMVQVARREYALHDPEAREALAAFAAGVNAARDAAVRSGDLPPEFVLLGYLPDPWRPEDALAIGKLMGWMLSLSFQGDLAVGLLRRHEELRDLLPDYPDPWPCIVGDGREEDAMADLLHRDRQGREAMNLGGPGMGSNSWVVAGSRTTTGRPLLANDPHLPFSLPAIWYQAVLEAQGFRAAGGALPGLPAILVGTNGRVAWGLTNGMVDDADFYVETVSPDDPGRYLADGRWGPFRIREETIQVRGEASARVRRVRFALHSGVECPVLSDIFHDRDGRTLSLRWTGLEPWPSLSAFLQIGAASNVHEARACLRPFGLPCQNVIAADADGNIAYILGGKVPVRPTPGSGSAPMDGASGEREWIGYIPFERMPQELNPPRGYIVTANQRVARDGIESHLWEPPYRARRIADLIEEGGPCSPEAFRRIHGDVYSGQADALVRGLIGEAPDRFADPRARQAARRLVGWDRRMTAESGEAALFHAFYRRLLGDVIRPWMDRARPGLFEAYFSAFHLGVGGADRVLASRDGPWWGGDRDRAVGFALAGAVADLSARLGPDPAAWRWGDLHPLVFRHLLGGGRGRLARLFARLLRWNRGPYPHPGDGMTVNLAAFTLTRPFDPALGPSYRQIIDLASPEGSCWIVAGGISGDPRSPHYDDQLGLWLRGEYLPLRLSPPSEAEGDRQTLVPASGTSPETL